MLSSPAMLMGSSLQELRDLRSLLGPESMAQLLEATLEHGQPSVGRFSQVTAHRRMGSIEFDALRTAAMHEGWTSDQVLALAAQYFTVEVAPSEAASARFGTPGEWIRRFRRSLGRRR